MPVMKTIMLEIEDKTYQMLLDFIKLRPESRCHILDEDELSEQERKFIQQNLTPIQPSDYSGAPREDSLMQTVKTVPVARLTHPSCFAAGTLVHTKEGLMPIEQIQIGDWVLSQPEQGGDKAYKRVTQTFRFEDDAVWAVTYCEKAAQNRARSGGGLIDYPDYSRLIVSPNHPFWVNDKGWGSVQNLTRGCEIELADGNLALIREVIPLYNHNEKDKPFQPSYLLDGPIGVVIDLTNGNSGETVLPKKGFPDELALSAEELSDPQFYFRATVYNLEVEDFHTYYVGTKGVWVHNTCYVDHVGSP